MMQQQHGMTLRQFAERIVSRATQMAAMSTSGDTLLHFKWASVQREAGMARFPLASPDLCFDELAGAIATLGGATSLLGVLGKREGFIFSTHVCDARDAERHVAEAWRTSPTLRVCPVSMEDVINGADLRAVTEAVLECGLLTVCVTSTKPGVNTRRIDAVRAALARCEEAHDVIVPHVTLDDLGTIPSERRQWLVVDRAHLLGSVEWIALMRQSPYIVAVGCLAIPAPLPGLTLIDLAVAETNDVAAIRAQLGAIVLRKWGASDSSLPSWRTLGDYLASACRDKTCRCIILQPPPNDKDAKTALEVARRRNGAPAFLTFRDTASLCDALDTEPAKRRRLVLFDEAMSTWTLSQWLYAIVFGARPACIVGGVPRTVAFYVAMLQAARHFPRRLAMHHRPALI